MLKTSHIKKMAMTCHLDELGLETEILCGQFASMAQMLPNALKTVVTQTRSQEIPNFDEITETM